MFHISPKDGEELDKVIVPAILGAKIVPGYLTYVEHVVQPGETLWAIATQYYGSGNLYHRLVAANPHTIPNPNLIHPGDIVRFPATDLSVPTATLAACSTSSCRWNAAAVARRRRGGARRVRGNSPSRPTSRT